MPDQKKKLKKEPYWPLAAVAGVGGAGIAAGELEGKENDKRADAAENRARNHDANAARLESQAGGSTAAERAEHAEKAKVYEKWASRGSTTGHPYVTPELREEAVRRYREHSGKATRTSSRVAEMGARWAREDAGMARSTARSYRDIGNGARLSGRVAGGALVGTAVLGGIAVAHNNHKWREEQHRRNHGKFAPTDGVKKNMDEVSKLDWREELHRRANDGRFQAGAAGTAGAGLAAASLRSGNRRAAGLRAAAAPHAAEATAHRTAESVHRDGASVAEEKARNTKGRTRRAATKEAADLRGKEWGAKAKAFGAEEKAAPLLRGARSASRGGKLSAALALGAGAAGVAAGVHNHRKQALVSDLESTTMEKNDSAAEIFAKAREKSGAVAGGIVGTAAGAEVARQNLPARGAAKFTVKHALNAMETGSNGSRRAALTGANVTRALGHPAGRVGTAVAAGAAGAAIGHAALDHKVKKNLEESTVAELFAKAREEEVEKGLLDGAARVAGTVGAKAKTGANFAGAKATAGFKSAAPKIKTAGAKAKGGLNTGVQRSSEFAWSNPGKAAAIGGGALGAAGGAGYLAGRKN